MPNWTSDRVPAARLGRPGTQRHKHQAPMDVLSDNAIAPTTSAQYPHPARPRRMDTTTETTRATTSLAETAEKHIARFSRARCCTEILVMKMVAETPTAIRATCGSP